MTKGRMEAFSDGVLAIIITIMVLEFAVPHEADWDALRPLVPKAAVYLLSFVLLAIYWNNHHHLAAAAKHVNGAILWANMHLLFWLSLVPFATAWMGENDFAPAPVAFYGVVLLMAAFAYFFLQAAILKTHEPESPLRVRFESDVKGKLSPMAYIAAIGLSFVMPLLSMLLYVGVAVMWLIPDRRIERVIVSGE